LDKATGRHDGEKMRLVGNHDILVDMNDARLEWNAWFIGNFTEVADGQAVTIGRVDGQRQAGRVKYAGAVKAILPFNAANPGEMRTQAIKHGRPCAWRQTQRAGIDHWWRSQSGVNRHRA